MDSEGEERAAASLFQRAREGEQDAFGQLLELYRRPLEALAYLSLGPRLRTRVDYEDVIQDAFIRACELRDKLEWRGSRKFFRWLAQIARHVIQGEARRHKDLALVVPLSRLSRHGGLSGDGRAADVEDAASPPAVSPLKSLCRNERFDRLEMALNELAADRREALVCAHIHGLSTREIARRLGRSPGAVGVLIHRAKEDLKRRFGDTESIHLPARVLAPGLLGAPARPETSEKRRGWRLR